jgi:error-prone DNA polymerase
MRYIELHGRSSYSFLEGAAHPDALAYGCVKLELPAMALLDRNGVYGSPAFHHIMKLNGLKAHVGAEVAVADHATAKSPYYPLLVRTQRGYKNLSRLITTTKLRAKKNTPTAATLLELRQFADGLVCLTGDEDGPLADALRKGGKEEAKHLLERLKDIFGPENVHVELQRHFRPEQERRNQIAVELARELHLPLIATNGVLYPTPQDQEILDAFTCIKNKCTLDNAGRLLAVNAERHLRTANEMAQLFRDLPEAISNTVELSSRLEFTLENLGYEFPRYPVPDGGEEIDFLCAQVWKGASERYGNITDRIRNQLERELALIRQLKLAGYFLIVWDIIRFCRENNILVQGRGSAANSAVCYCLRITAVDPIAMELLFERFLSEARGEWPDIDLDLPSGDDREKVIQYVYRRYGPRGVAMTANVITYRARSAAREMGKVLGFGTQTLDRLSGALGSWEWKDPNDTLAIQFRRAGLDSAHARIQRLMSLCERVQNMPRHLGQHSGGMIVCQGMLDEVVPLEPATMEGRTVCQWDKDAAESLGLIKIDLLGLGALGAVRDSVELIKRHYGKEIDLAHLPEDSKVYKTIASADTVGTFQIESRAQMASLPLNNPQCRYDLTTQVAIIRPGPIEGQATRHFLLRRQGKEPVTYTHPILEPILKRTLGVVLFQEQLLRIAMVAANFTAAEAEELRRALGSKRSEQRVKALEPKLRSGMTANGLNRQQQDEVITHFRSFAKYGFPESHAASFALIAYSTAYLKVHYLAAYECALLNNWPMGFYHPASLIQDAKRHGLKYRMVDVNRSEWNCTLEHEGTEIVLRMGLRYVKGLKEESARLIIAERSRRIFHSVADFCRRVPGINKAELRMLAISSALASAGETDGTKSHRRDALWLVQKYGGWIRHPLLEGIVENDRYSPLLRMTLEDRLVADYEATGLTLSQHPMGYRRDSLRRMGIKSGVELTQVPDGRWATAAGHVSCRQRPGTANGTMFITLEDETGFANVIVPKNTVQEHWATACNHKFLKVRGVVQNDGGVVHLLAKSIVPLEVSAARMQSHDFH